MIKEIKQLGDPILRRVSHKVRRQPQAYIQSIITDLIDTARENEALGLAAPQIGVPLRIVVVKSGDQYYRLINPEITLAAGSQTALEGCLSLPAAYRALVPRATRIGFRSAAGRGQATGMLARIIQHEIDHLDGIVIIDKEVEHADPEEEEAGTVAGVL